jgi:hypothetical protein
LLCASSTQTRRKENTVNNPQKKMYKVFATVDLKNGGTYWMKVGAAFTNRDDSINLYLDAIPPPDRKSNRYELQIREYTEEDRRRSEANRSSAPSTPDYGGVGGGPSVSSRAVTAAASSANDVPF